MRRTASLVLFCLATSFAHAQSAPAQPPLSITVGASIRMAPAYEGSEDLRFRPLPVISFGREQPRTRFRGVEDGISIGLFETDMVRAGPMLKFRFPRDDNDHRALRGLDNVGFALEPGFFVDVYPVQGLRLRAEARHGIGGHRGFVGDLSADVFFDVTEQLRLSAGPRLAVASGRFFDAYFGITPAESLRSGLPVFTPGSGLALRSVGFGAAATTRWTDRWSTTLFAEYDRLTGPAAQSPLTNLVGSRNQFMIGVSASYRFDLPM